MIISEKYKFIFIHIYKNAGTSIRSALSPFSTMSVSSQFTTNHATAHEIKEKIGEKFNEYFSFAIVRNPWDWQVSLYSYILKNEFHPHHNLVKNLGSFEEYIKWRCKNDVHYQKDFIYQNNELLVNFVGRYENLDSDFQKICSRIGICTKLPKLNVSNTTPYQKFYSETTKNLIKEVFEPDIRTFNYEF